MVCAASRRHEVGSLGRVLLPRLGINVDAPAEHYRVAYERFLPSAHAGYFAALREAHRQSRLAAGPDPWASAEDEFEWLVHALRIGPPQPGDRWWQRLWQGAHERAGVARSRELDAHEVRQLVERLLEDEDVADALTAVLKGGR